MSGLDHIVVLARAYGEALGVENTTVSWRVFNDTKKLDAIIAGSDLQIRRYERALEWFAENWPADLAWPSDVPKPEHSEGRAA